MSTRLFDMLFASSPASMTSGDRTHARPRHVEWRRDDPVYESEPLVSWHTDGMPASLSAAPVRVKWLLEPRDNHPGNFTKEALDGFDVVYTHDLELLTNDPRARFYPLGGTRIHESDWGRLPDFMAGCSSFDWLPSIVASPKRSLPGHQLRHDLIAACPTLSVFGPEYSPLREKYDSLKGSLFHVAIEPVRSRFYVSEHLIDALIAMNVPVYWGAAAEVLAGLGFDPDGIMFVNDIYDLVHTVRGLADRHTRQKEWERRWEAIEHNFRAACRYTCPEDWLYLRDPALFEAAA